MNRLGPERDRIIRALITLKRLRHIHSVIVFYLANARSNGPNFYPSATVMMNFLFPSQAP